MERELVYSNIVEMLWFVLQTLETHYNLLSFASE